MPSTVTFTYVVSAPVDRVWRAFSDPTAIPKWFPPHGFTCKIHSFNFKVGGTYKMEFLNFSAGVAGASDGFSGKYLQIKTHELIKWTDRFDNPALAADMFTTIHFRKVSVGTELKIEQSGLPDVIPPESCYIGWQQSLSLLSLLCEPNIPNEQPPKKEEAAKTETNAEAKAESKQKKRKRN